MWGPGVSRGLPPPLPLQVFFVTLSKTRRGGRPHNLMSTLCLTQCDPPIENPGYAPIGDTNIEFITTLVETPIILLITAETC